MHDIPIESFEPSTAIPSLLAWMGVLANCRPLKFVGIQPELANPRCFLDWAISIRILGVLYGQPCKVNVFERTPVEV